MLRLFTLILIVCLFVMGGVYIFTMSNVRTESLLMKLDVWGITDVGKREQERIRNINKLYISSYKKKVLQDRAIFIGASQKMVNLALGKPKYWFIDNKQNINLLVYHPEGEKRPTVLEFQGDALKLAYKVSLMDINTMKQKYSVQN